MKSFIEHITESVKKTVAKKIIKKQNDNDKVYKDWRNSDKDYETTKKIVGEERLDELRRLSDEQKKKLQKRIRDKHDKAWDKTQQIRKEKKSSGSADTKDMDKFRNRLGKMHNKLDEANSRATIKLKAKHYGDTASRMEKEMNKRSTSSNPVERAMMSQVHGAPGSAKSKKTNRKIMRMRQASKVAKEMLKKK